MLCKAVRNGPKDAEYKGKTGHKCGFIAELPNTITQTQSKSRGSKQTQKQDWGNRQITNRKPETRGQETLNNEILNNNKYKIITKIKITN